MTLFELFELYKTRNLRCQKRNTHELFECAIRNFGRHLGRLPTVDDLSDDELSRFIQARRAAGRSPHTVTNEYAKIAAIWRFAAKQKLAGWPTLVVARPKPPQPKAWSRAELKKLWRAAYRCPRTIFGIPGGLYWPAFIGVLFDTAERVSPVFELRMEDIDFDRRLVWLRNRKGNDPDCQREISKRTAKDLANLIEYVDGSPFKRGCRTTIYKSFSKVLRDAGLPDGPKHKFHVLRKCHATYVECEGRDASHALGHADPRVTRESYIDPVIAPKRRKIPKPLRWIWWRWIKAG